jgi:hypothetical protein
MDRDNFNLMDGDNVHDPTTTVQGWCALATDTLTPRIIAFLWCTTRPWGHLSCKQSKNKQEQVEQALNCKINMNVSIWKHKMVGFWRQSDGRFIQHARWKAVQWLTPRNKTQPSGSGCISFKYMRGRPEAWCGRAKTQGHGQYGANMIYGSLAKNRCHSTCIQKRSYMVHWLKIGVVAPVDKKGL